jgi:hypothetical protein
LKAYDLPPDRLDRDLVLTFFWTFSAFECALKREGFLRAGRSANAEADWTAFGKSLRGRFGEIPSEDFHESVAALKVFAPRRQVVRHGELRWEPVARQADQSDEEHVLHLLKTARNNLFHGGKYPDGPVAEVARNNSLLQAALAVLEGCYLLHPSLTRWMDPAA